MRLALSGVITTIRVFVATDSSSIFLSRLKELASASLNERERYYCVRVVSS